MKKINFDSIIFDIDGVLISNAAYNQTIINTVEFFIRKDLGVMLEITTDEIYQIKKIEGFNNDWDVSYGLISLIEKNIALNQIPMEIRKISSKTRDTSKYKIIKDIFQSFYLGKEVFEEVYKREASVDINPGLIENENLLFDLIFLTTLSKKYKLAIATSRPRYEAVYTTRIKKISPEIIGFKKIVAKEDAPREKPYPDPLLEAARRIDAKNSVYVGDTINDVLAANKAGMLSIYVGSENLGDIRVKNVNELKEILI